MMELIKFIAESEEHFAGTIAILILSIIGLCMIFYWLGYAIEGVLRAWRKK